MFPLQEELASELPEPPNRGLHIPFAGDSKNRPINVYLPAFPGFRSSELPAFPDSAAKTTAKYKQRGEFFAKMFSTQTSVPTSN